MRGVGPGSDRPPAVQFAHLIEIGACDDDRLAIGGTGYNVGEGHGEAILKVIAPTPAGENSLTITWPVGKLRETWTDAIPKAMA